MADLIITAANVVASSDATAEKGLAGVNITAGQAVYKDTVTGKYLLADADSATVAQRRAVGISLNGAALNQPLTVLTSGPYTVGSAVTPGVAYYLSGTAGGICPVADIGTGEFVCLIGFATNATTIAVAIQFPNVAL
jgi:hypothetical protein